MSIRLIAIVFLVAVPTIGTSQSVDETTVLARVGPHTITEQDFLERIDLVPWPGKDNPGLQDSAKITALSSLVAEKLLSLQAVSQGIASAEGTVPHGHCIL